MNLHFYNYSTKNLSFYGYDSSNQKNALIQIDDNIQEVTPRIFSKKFNEAYDVDIDKMAFANPDQILCTQRVSACVAIVAKTYENNKHFLTGIVHHCIVNNIDHFFKTMITSTCCKVDLCIIGGAGLISINDDRYQAIFNAMTKYSNFINLKMEIINPWKFPDKISSYDERQMDKLGLSYSVGVDIEGRTLYSNNWNFKGML